MRLTAIRNKPTRTISASSGLWLLQMLLEPDTKWCASKDAGPPRGMDCKIAHWLERGTKHSLQGCVNLSLVDAFENREADDDT